MGRPTPQSVSVVLGLIGTQLAEMQEDLEKYSFQHPERARDLRALRRFAVELRKRKTELADQGASAPLNAVQALVTDARLLRRRIEGLETRK